MDKVIEYSFDKKKAIQLVKKAVSGKFAIMKDDGDVLKVGAPMMTAVIKITDKTIEVSGKGAAGPVAQTCASEIEMAVEEYQEQHAGGNAAPAPNSAQPVAPASQPTPEAYLEYKTKAIGLLKQFKELFDAGILSEEEFKAQKADLLNFINGMTRQ